MTDPLGSHDVPAASHADGGDFGRFRDLSLSVAAVLGSARMSVRACLALRRGSIVRLDQAAGDDLSVYVNGVLIARGEVVIADNRSAVRLSTIVPPEGHD